MSDEPKPAGRVDDLIEHNYSQLGGLLAWAADELGLTSAIGKQIAKTGLVWAARASRVVRVALIASGPEGWIVLGASIVVEWGVSKAFEWALPKIGDMFVMAGEMGVEQGSPDVTVNLRKAARKDDKLKCSHKQKIMQGSEWVSINTKPASRIGDRTHCSGKIGTGSKNVLIGGPATSYDNVSDIQQALEVIGKVRGYADTAMKKGPREVAKEAAKDLGKTGGKKALEWLWGQVK